MKSKEIVRLIKNNKIDDAFDAFYKEYRYVERYLVKNGASKEHVKDIFQQTMYVVYQKIQEDNFRLTGTLRNFLIGISKNIWLKYLRQLKEKSHEIMDLFTNTNSEESYLYENKLQIFKDVLLELDERCLKILKLFYFEKWNMNKISRALGFKNDHVARTQKYKCLEYAKKEAQERLVNYSQEQ